MLAETNTVRRLILIHIIVIDDVKMVLEGARNGRGGAAGRHKELVRGEQQEEEEEKKKTTDRLHGDDEGGSEAPEANREDTETEDASAANVGEDERNKWTQPGKGSAS